MMRVEDRRSRFGIISIFRRTQTGSVTYEEFGSCQSEADRDGVSLASYIHAIYGLILQTQARDVLMIGGGGGTLGTMLVRAGREVTIVDINPDSFSLARRYFNLPDEVICCVADGGEHLQNENRRYGAIVLDAYQGDRIPTHLRSPDFFRLVRRCLAPHGCFFANIHIRDDADPAADDMAQDAADVWPDMRLLDSPGWNNRNAIMMAGDVMRLERPALRVYPADLAAQIAFELESMEFRAWCRPG